MSPQSLTNRLMQSGVLETPAIINAFNKIDRADFVRADLMSEAYADYPLPIGSGQTISQPTTVAFMLELLGPKQGDKILDVGSGSGWTTSLLGYIVAQKKIRNSKHEIRNELKTQNSKLETGYVYGVEKIPALVEFGQENLYKYPDLPATIKPAGKTYGLPAQAPFAKILVSASATKLPRELIDQLQVGGTLVIPIENSIYKITKTAPDDFGSEEFPGFVFVPLV